jgi:hypothetical protein
MSAVPATPTTEQLVTAFAQALLPLAGPWGIAASTVIPAAEQFISNLKATGNTVYTMADLEAAAAKATTDLGQLAADIAASQQKP